MKELHQTVNNSRVENMAGRDINITVIQAEAKPFPRNQLIHEILSVRNSCPHLEYLIKTHAQKAYGSCFFKEMPEEQLTEMHQFVMELKKAVEKREMPSWVRWVLGWFGKRKIYGNNRGIERD